MPGPKPGTPRPTREQVLHRENRAWDLRVNHAWTQQRIAAEIGVSRSAVDAILRRLARRVTKQLEAEVRSEIVRQLAILDHIVDEAMQAWEASKAGSVEQETTRGPGGRFVETTTWRSSCGDPAYLREVLAVLDSTRRLLGLDAPTVIRHLGQSDEPAPPLRIITVRPPLWPRRAVSLPA